MDLGRRDNQNCVRALQATADGLLWVVRMDKSASSDMMGLVYVRSIDAMGAAAVAFVESTIRHHGLELLSNCLYQPDLKLYY